MTEDILEEVDLEQLKEFGVALARDVVNQKVYEYTEEYKLIIGEECIDTFNTTNEKVDEQLIVQENEQIIDYLIEYDDLPVRNFEENNTLPLPARKSLSDIQVSYKKKIINTVQTILDKFLPSSVPTVQTSLDTFIKNTNTQISPSSFIERLAQSITTGVRNSLNTPDTLFSRVPDENVLQFLENRVFVATEQTMNKVADNIYNIISKEAEQEGKHPYEVAETLRKEFTQLSENESRKIARTEVLRSKNESTWQRLNNNETVEYVQWSIGVLDDNSRDDHVAQNEMITRIGTPFPNGQRYPYDELSDPGDYINCRCGIEAYYPDVNLVPPEGADWWFESEMVEDKNGLFDFNVIFND